METQHTLIIIDNRNLLNHEIEYEMVQRYVDSLPINDDRSFSI